jgi:hypothetical protein
MQYETGTHGKKASLIQYNIRPLLWILILALMAKNYFYTKGFMSTETLEKPPGM